MSKKVCEHKAAMTVVNQAKGNYLLKKNYLIIHCILIVGVGFLTFHTQREGNSMKILILKIPVLVKVVLLLVSSLKRDRS